MVNEKVICFDMDGTLGDFYGVEGWLDDLMTSNPRPYREAKPRFNFSSLARLLHKLQRRGYEINIIRPRAKKYLKKFAVKADEHLNIHKKAGTYDKDNPSYRSTNSNLVNLVEG